MKNQNEIIKVYYHKWYKTYPCLFYIFLLSIIGFTFPTSSFGQCNGIALGGYGNSNFRFDTYNQVMSGGTYADAVHLGFYLFNGCNCNGWRLTVRAATANFTDGTNYIPVNQASLQFHQVSGNGPSGSAIGINNNLIPLSTIEQNIVASSNAAFKIPPNDYYFTQDYNLILNGGASYLKASRGIYRVSLIFTLYDANNHLISTVTLNDVGFNLQYSSIAGNYSLLLQNGSNLIDFNFDSPIKMQNGISVTKNNGMTVHATSNYQINANTITGYLHCATNAYQIPVSVINLQVTPTSSISGVTGYSRVLSASNMQPFVMNSNATYPNFYVTYNLRYFINGNNTYILNAPPGSYTETLVFSASPL